MNYPGSPEEWKRVEEKFRKRWNVPHVVGALDGKHIAMKKSKKTGSDYYNYEGFFPGSPGPGGRRIPNPVDKLWVKWFVLRFTADAF